ncbi:MAG: putative selenate ABC transporter substrate-binding protein [Pseudomonadota bacterium]
MNRRSLLNGLSAVAFVGIASFASPADVLAQDASASSLAFTLLPDQDPLVIEARGSELAEYLSGALGTTVQYVPMSSYEDAVAAFTNGDVQLAWFGGLTGLEARNTVEGSQALAQRPEDKAFISYFIANAGTGLGEQIDFPTDIAGKSFVFGAEDSTSGRLMPEYYIRQALGQAPADLFSQVGFSGNHTQTIRDVQSGEYEVGAVNHNVWNAAVEAGEVNPAQALVIWRTPTYPDYQWSIRGDVDAQYGDGTVEKVRAALLAIPETAVQDRYFASGLVSTSNDEYAPLAEAAKDIGLPGF